MPAVSEPKLRSRRTALLLKVEEERGVFQNDIDPLVDGIITDSLTPNFNPQTIDSNEATGSLDTNEGAEVAGLQASIEFNINLAGEGPGGTVPRWARAFQASGFQIQVTNAAIGNEPCADGGSTTSVILGALAENTDQIYRGMPIKITGDFGSGSAEVITIISDYDGDTKTATVTDKLGVTIDSNFTYEIMPNVLFRPGSGDIPSLSSVVYQDQVRTNFSGNTGNAQIVFPAKDTVQLRSSLQGNFHSRLDEEAPVLSYQRGPKPIFRDGVASLDRERIRVSNMTFDMQSNVQYDDDPNALFGFSDPEITSRAPQATLDPSMTRTATRNTVEQLSQNHEYLLHARTGSGDGNRISIVSPRAASGGLSVGERNDFTTEQLTLNLKGADANMFLCLY